MAFTAGFSVNVGDPTKASDVDVLAANDDYLKNAIDTFIANDANNRVLTATGSGTANAESNLTFDGSTLTVTGTVTATTFSGNVTGNLSGNVTGGTISGTTGTFTGALTGTTGTFATTGTGDVVIVETSDDTSTAGPILCLLRESTSPADGDYLGQIKFKGRNDAGQQLIYGKITAKTSDVTDGTEDSLIEIAVKADGSNRIVSRQKHDCLQLVNGTGLDVNGVTTLEDALNGTTASFSSTLGVTGATTLSSDVGIGVAAGSALTSTGTTLTIKEDDNTNSANIEMIGGNASGEVAGRIKASYTNNITSSEIRFSLGPNGADNGETMFFTRGPDGFLERFKVGQGTVSVTGDLAVDTDTLFVDASADRVGINTSSPQVDFHVDNASTNGVARISTSNAGSYAQLQLVNQSGNYWYQTIVSDNSYRLYNGSDRLTILSGGDVGLGTESPEIRLSVTDTYNGSALTSNDIPAVQIINEQGSYTADNVLGVLGFGKSQGFASGVRAGMVAHYSGTGSQSSNVGAYLSFRTSADGAGDSTERARIDSSGNLLVGRTGTDYNSETGLVLSGVGQVFYTRNASASNTTFAIYNNRDGAATNYINFMTGGTTRGSISWTSSSTSYNTTSDYRLKENVVGITDGITRIKSLKPSRFNFIAEADRTVDGFVAHEVSDVVPEAISGTKDAVDDEGNPEYQGIDQSKLVPLLTAALQEAITKIETLETKVAALEAA